MSGPVKLSVARARRIALAAQGFGGRRPRSVGSAQVRTLLQQVAQFQIDSVNVVERAHYLPLYSRFGPYDRGVLDRAAHRSPRLAFEYWGHAASLIDVTLAPTLRWRMGAYEADPWPEVAQLQADRPDLTAQIVTALHDEPRSARDLDSGEARDRSHWGWNWSTTKIMLEWLFATGQVGTARRNTQFERVYAPMADVLGPVADLPTPDLPTAHDTLVRRAARALGVASLKCLGDYFRLSTSATRQAVGRLEAAGELVAVQVPGWTDKAWLWHEAREPRKVRASALVSPFDSVVFERARLEGLFGFRYRIEIYVKPELRQYGYYVYPFLLDEQFCARVDLKADRAAGVLRVASAWAEAGVDHAHVASALLSELHLLASWLGLGDVEIAERGDLATQLRAAH